MRSAHAINIFLGDHLRRVRDFLSSLWRWKRGAVKGHSFRSLNPEIVDALDVAAEPESHPVSTASAGGRGEISAHHKELRYLLQCQIPVSPQAIFIGLLYQCDELSGLKYRNPVCNLCEHPAPVIHCFLTNSLRPFRVRTARFQPTIRQCRRRLGWAKARLGQMCEVPHCVLGPACDEVHGLSQKPQRTRGRGSVLAPSGLLPYRLR